MYHIETTKHLKKHFSQVGAIYSDVFIGVDPNTPGYIVDSGGLGGADAYALVRDPDVWMIAYIYTNKANELVFVKSQTISGNVVEFLY